jgi:hypothetical protein
MRWNDLRDAALPSPRLIAVNMDFRTMLDPDLIAMHGCLLSRTFDDESHRVVSL